MLKFLSPIFFLPFLIFSIESPESFEMLTEETSPTEITPQMRGAVKEFILKNDKDPTAKYLSIAPLKEGLDTFENAFQAQQNATSDGVLTKEQKALVDLRKKMNQEMVDWQNSPLFDTSFLENPPAVRHFLITQRGYKSVQFKTCDGHTLSGLYKCPPNPRISAVVVAGFHPGLKEGMASMEELYEKDVAILFYDSRGHGESSGSLAKSIFWDKNCGLYETNDVIAATEFVRLKQPDVDVHWFGTCLGAFHMVNAAIALNKKNRIDKLGLKRIVLDSLWTKMVDAGYSVASDKLTGWKSPFYYLANLIYHVVLKGTYQEVEKEVNLPGRMGDYPRQVETELIHGIFDKAVPIECVRSIGKSFGAGTIMHEFYTENPHALLMLKEKHAYQEIIQRKKV